MEEGSMAAGSAAVPAQRNMLDSYFKVTEAGSTIGTEVRGGLTNFLVM
jgi:AGZA family xanthine/uracil permease-like MFS transporter